MNSLFSFVRISAKPGVGNSCGSTLAVHVLGLESVAFRASYVY